MGIAEQEFIDCFADVEPTRRGEVPSAGRKHMNKAVLLPCLQEANPEITNEKLDAVMDRYRPEGSDTRRVE